MLIIMHIRLLERCTYIVIGSEHTDNGLPVHRNYTECYNPVGALLFVLCFLECYVTVTFMRIGKVPLAL